MARRRKPGVDDELLADARLHTAEALLALLVNLSATVQGQSPRA